ncbi:hypothetical protein JIY74_30985, partial [Vibrio harveyi]|nr:hypothetical protein [Vibrio harveyi]
MKNLLAILKAVTAFSGAENHSSTEHNLTTLTNKSEINTSESINNIAREQDHEIDPVNYSVKINISSLDLNPNTGVFNSNEPNAIIETFIRN